MKTNKNKAASTLTTGDVVARKTVTLPMGHVVQLTVTYDGPNCSIPLTVADWPVESDWPAAQISVVVPGRTHRLPTEDMELDLPLCGHTLLYTPHTGHTWGNGTTGYTHACRTRRLAGASLRQLAAQLLRETQAELRPIRAHLQARADRIAARGVTLEAGLDMPAAKKQQ